MNEPTDRDLLIRLDARVEALHRELLGNGQPGRIAVVEERVDSLEQTRDRARGWLAGASAILAAIWGGLEYLIHRK